MSESYGARLLVVARLVMVNPAPQALHFDNPENRYRRRLATPMLPVRVIVRRVAL